MNDEQMPKPVESSAAHKRGIRATLVFLDEGLCEIEQWAKGRVVSSALYAEANDLTSGQRTQLLTEVAHLRLLLREMADSLKLRPERRTAQTAVSSLCSSMWEHTVELGGRYLRRYGEPPAELIEYLDTKSDELASGLRRILDASRNREPSREGRGDEV